MFPRNRRHILANCKKWERLTRYRKIENFIRTKYESKRWVMDGQMPDPATLDDEDDVVCSPPFNARCNESTADILAIAP